MKTSDQINKQQAEQECENVCYMKFMGLVSRDTIKEVSANADIKNPYVRLVDHLGRFLDRNEICLCSSDNWDSVLGILRDVHLEKGFTLDDYRSKQLSNSGLKLYARSIDTARPSEREWIIHEVLNEDINGKLSPSFIESSLGVKIYLGHHIRIGKPRQKALVSEEDRAKLETEYPRNFPKRTEVKEHLTVPFTEMGLWQAYWLHHMGDFIGMRENKYMYELSVISGKNDIPAYGVNDRRALEQLPDDLSPTILLHNGAAKIEYYYWSNFSGLNHTKCELTYDNSTNHIININEEKEVLIKYVHCYML